MAEQQAAMANTAADYNARLFRGGLRRAIHVARFIWVRDTLNRLQCSPRSIVELGCMDGKLLTFLSRAPDRYLGLDALPERIAASRKVWREHAFAEFRVCTKPGEMALGDEKFEAAVSMETLEHVPPELMEPYVDALFAAATRYVLITVPNEKGAIFLLRHLYKLFSRNQPKDHTLADIVNSTLGRMHKVKRDGHRGFDYETVIAAMGKHGRTVVSGIPWRFLPVSLNTQVGIVGIKTPECAHAHPVKS